MRSRSEKISYGREACPQASVKIPDFGGLGTGLPTIISNYRIRRKKAFTLLEVVITLSIIVVLGSFVYFGGDYGSESRALQRAATDLHMLLRTARSQAILDGRDARLIINIDEDDSNRFLRYAGVIVRDENNPALWKATHGGLVLPEGIYVVPHEGFGDGVAYGDWDVSVTNRKSVYKCINSNPNALAIANVDYPLIDSVTDNAGGDPQWIVYQFSPDGSLDASDAPGCPLGAAAVDNQIVLAPAIRNANDDVEFNDSENILGIRLRQNGVSVAVNDPLDL